MGNRAAEVQLRVLWEEILKRFSRIEVIGEPERAISNFILGYSQLTVKLHASARRRAGAPLEPPTPASPVLPPGGEERH